MTSLPRHAGRASRRWSRSCSSRDASASPPGRIREARRPGRDPAAQADRGCDPAPSPTIAPTATPDDGATPVEVSLTDSMAIKPAKITVEAGKPVRFVITNEGALEHGFFLGSDKEQKQRESGQGEPGPDRYVEVPPGETVTLLYTFPSEGRTIAGCVVPGHYSAGMKANITIE